MVLVVGKDWSRKHAKNQGKPLKAITNSIMAGCYHK